MLIILMFISLVVLQHLIFYKYEYDWSDGNLGLMKIVGGIMMIIFIYIIVYKVLCLANVLYSLI
ncbi:MAG: hypothetical protein DRG30_09600 [Epsilonproteobacteria bacterium]|nr:MAG: hypothetical protein DRG30_09600 [Campylobacterota bacterium]